jgi:hypothetical protein
MIQISSSLLMNPGMKQLAAKTEFVIELEPTLANPYPECQEFHQIFEAGDREFVKHCLGQEI